MLIAFHRVEDVGRKDIEVVGHMDLAFQGAWSAPGRDGLRRRPYLGNHLIMGHDEKRRSMASLPEQAAQIGAEFANADANMLRGWADGHCYFLFC